MLWLGIVCLTCQGNQSSSSASISSDGRYVAFESGASNLVDGDTNNDTDVFVADVETGAIECLTCGVDGASLRPIISGDGRFVMFVSFAALDQQDTNGNADAFVYDRATASIRRMTNSGWADGLSASGRFLALEQWPNGIVFDQRTGSSVQLNDAPTLIGGITLSANGRFACYRTLDYTQPYKTIEHSYIRDALTGVSEQLDDGSGQFTGCGPVSNDGRYVVQWEHDNLVLHDRTLGTAGPIGKYPTGAPAITPDGRYIAWTEYPDFGLGQIVVLDQTTGTVRFETKPAECWDPVLSDNGQRIAFVQLAENGIANIYVKSRTAELLSRN